MQRLDAEVPQHIRDLIIDIKPSCWLKRACSRYRRCSSMHFGLGIPRNISRKQRMMFGRFSKEMPGLQQELLNWIKSVCDIDFCSIILNKYEVGDSMGKHIDGNLLPIQLAARFGDGVGGELHCGGESVQTGVFLMDANMPHWVSPLQSGTLYSIITYIKKDSFWMADCATLAQLSSWGFPLRSVGLIVLFLLSILTPKGPRPADKP